MGRRTGALVVAVLAALALGGCSADSPNGSSEAAAPAVAPAPPGQEKADGTADAKQAAAQPLAQSRQLVRTAQLDLRGQDVEGVLARVKDLAQREGGFAGQENSGQTYGSLTLRVPGDRLDGVINEVGGLDGVEVLRREVRTEDVTEQVVDIEARLATQRASVDRVRVLLDRAATTSEITQIEGELTKRQTELESLQRRYGTLKGQVALSTLTVSVRQDDQVVVEEGGFLAAFGAGWEALLDALRWLLVVFGAVLPFAIVLGIPAVVLVLLRRRRKAATAVAVSAPAE